MVTPVNPAAIQFRDQFYLLVPPWLRTGNGERYMYSLETCRDMLCEKAYQAFSIRIPGVGDPSNLSFLSFDRNLVRGPAEPEASFAARLSGALQAWNEAGSVDAVLEQLQAYLQGLQPGVAPTLPWLTIVGVAAGEVHDIAIWNQVYQNTPIGAQPTLTTVYPTNIQWDLPVSGEPKPTWRRWLILPMALVATGLAGSAAATSTAAASACFTSPGQNVNGVWVPATSGTPVNTPWLTLTGLAGLSAAQVGQWITNTGSGHAGNNGCFQIVSFVNPTSCVVANPNGVAADAGPLTWTIGAYPFIGPGPAWGSPGVVFGQGEQTPPGPPPPDTGTNFGGVWQPAASIVTATAPTISWGLNCRADLIATIRSIVKRWKSAGTYYQHIVVAFDAGTGAPGDAYSPNSTQGAGNPDGTFGQVGKNVGGVWVPTRIIGGNPQTPYLWDCFCQGTGEFKNCSVENLT